MPPAKKAAAKKATPPRARKRAATGRPAKAPPTPPKKGVATNAPTSMTMVRVGSFDYPLVSSPQCRTCQSPHRQWIENELLLGRSYGSIADRLSDMESDGRLPHPRSDSMRAHVEHGHTPGPAKVRRQIMDRRAQELGSKILGDDSIVDHVALNSLMLQQAHEDLMSGKIELGASDITAIIKTRMEIEKTSDNGYDVEVMEAALFAQMETTVQMLPPEQLAEYARQVDQHPVLRAALKKVRDAGAIEGEVVGD